VTLAISSGPCSFQGRLIGFFRATSIIKTPSASVILVVATVLTAECKEFWQLLLCQGLLTGFACGMIFGPLPAIVSQWFKKRRSLAFGVIAAGSSLGGTIIPIAARHLVELIGYVGAQCIQRAWLIGFFSFKWMMRTIALIELFMLTIANLVRISMSSSVDTGSITLPSDSQAKARSSPKDRSILLLARFPKACVQRVPLWWYP